MEGEFGLKIILSIIKAMNEGEARRDDLVGEMRDFLEPTGNSGRIVPGSIVDYASGSSSLRFSTNLESRTQLFLMGLKKCWLTKAICDQSDCAIANETQIWYRGQVAIAN
jgi:hypothetical protein